LLGQYYQRVFKGFRDSLTVTAMASLEILFVLRDFMDDVQKAVVAQVS
jgi:hypothetical protein